MALLRNQLAGVMVVVMMMSASASRTSTVTGEQLSAVDRDEEHLKVEGIEMENQPRHARAKKRMHVPTQARHYMAHDRSDAAFEDLDDMVELAKMRLQKAHMDKTYAEIQQNGTEITPEEQEGQKMDPETGAFGEAAPPPPALSPQETEALERIAKVIDAVDPLEIEVSGIVSQGRTGKKDLLRLNELLTRQLLALDAIEAPGAARAVRKQQVVRINQLCDDLDHIIPSEE